MTRRQAGITRENKPTRATKRRSINNYCRSMQHLGGGLYRDSYGQKYQETHNGSLFKV